MPDGEEGTCKKMKDNRVSRLFAWMLANYPSSQLMMRLLLRQENSLADLMSRRGVVGVGRASGLTRGQTCHLKDEEWGILHSNHHGMATMMHTGNQPMCR